MTLKKSPIPTSSRIWSTISFDTASRHFPPREWSGISRKSLLIFIRFTSLVFPRSWDEMVDPVPFFISASIVVFMSGVMELSYTKTNDDHFMVSVVFKSIKICCITDAVVTCGDKIEVENRDLGQPVPIHANKFLSATTILCNY